MPDVSEMKVLVVNPNTTASMTEKIGTGRPLRGGGGVPDCRGEPGERAPSASRTITTRRSASPASSPKWQRAKADGVDAAMVACFDDPRPRPACRELMNFPVVGICEAAMHAAAR